MYRKRIISREASWTGVNGRTYNRTAFIDVIFYDINKSPNYTYGADGVAIGGGGETDLNKLASFINSRLAKGSPKTSPTEIAKRTIKARAEMIKGEHKWFPPEYPNRDKWFNELY